MPLWLAFSVIGILMFIALFGMVLMVFNAVTESRFRADQTTQEEYKLQEDLKLRTIRNRSTRFSDEYLNREPFSQPAGPGSGSRRPQGRLPSTHKEIARRAYRSGGFVRSGDMTKSRRERKDFSRHTIYNANHAALHDSVGSSSEASSSGGFSGGCD